jgi:hypothetical protein
VLQRLGELFVEELTRGMRPDPGTEGEVNPAGLLPRAGLLCGTLQVPPGKVILGHLNRLPDLSLQRQTAETGAFLAFDGPSRANHATDWRLYESLAELVRRCWHGPAPTAGRCAARGR